jgi:hypothetical protein
MTVGICGLQLREGCRERAEWPSGALVLAKLVRNHPETYHAIFGFDADLPSRSLDFVRPPSGGGRLFSSASQTTLECGGLP